MTILALVWWQWVLVVLAAAVALVVLMLRAFRAGVRREFIDYLARHHPDIQVTGQSGAALKIRTPGGAEGTFFLGRLYSAVANVKVDDAAGKEAAFASFAGTIGEADALEAPLSLDAHADRLMPRLFPAGQEAALQATSPVPKRLLGETGLCVVYVLDSEHSVAYLDTDRMKELGLTEEQLHDRAMENLRKRTPPDMMRKALDGQSVGLVKFGDTYDAARLLIVQEQLAEGESIGAVVPDRDLMVLVQLPPGAEAEFRHFNAPSVSDRSLLSRPLVVTRTHIRLA